MPDIGCLGFLERVGLLVDSEIAERDSRRLADRLRLAKLKQAACLEDLDLLEILDDCYGIRSTLVTSQLPVDHWHESIGDPTLADAILDRLVHNAHRIALKGKSKRKREYPALGGDDGGTAATGG